MMHCSLPDPRTWHIAGAQQALVSQGGGCKGDWQKKEMLLSSLLADLPGPSIQPLWPTPTPDAASSSSYRDTERRRKPHILDPHHVRGKPEGCLSLELSELAMEGSQKPWPPSVCRKRTDG